MSVRLFVAERLLVDVAAQVVGLDADVGPVQAALQERPEVLHGVGVDVAVGVLDGVIDDGVLIVGFQTVVGEQFIGEDRGSGFNVITDVFLKFLLAPVVNYEGAHVAAALDHSKDDGFILAARPRDLLGAFGRVHVARFAADEGFVYFDFTAEFAKIAGTHRTANTHQHEPRGFLGNAEMPTKFARTDPVFAIADQPRRCAPLL